MLRKSLLILGTLLPLVSAQADEVTFPRASVKLSAPVGWEYSEEGTKHFLRNPDQLGKIQVYLTKLKKEDLASAVALYHATTFEGVPARRAGKSIVILEKGEVETTTGLKGVKGAFGYAEGKDGKPEVWTWRYFFARPDGRIVTLCAFVYGDEERAKAQEEVIVNSLKID